MIRTIPLEKLIPSSRNVRRSTDPRADEQLKADIAACGLLQNLVVAPMKKPKGCFTVEAGGRRLRALKALADAGTLSATLEVACLVIGGGSVAQEASIAENFQRLAMISNSGPRFGSSIILVPSPGADSTRCIRFRLA